MDHLGLRKAVLRKELREKRALASVQYPDAGAALCRVFQEHVKPPTQAVVSFYCCHDGEIDPEPLVHALEALEHPLSLPCGQKRGECLSFRHYAFGDPLAPGLFKIPEPLPEVAFVVPDVLLVPLVGFDRKGQRLGMGGGYYDRTLEALRKKKHILAVGLAYADQEIDDMPITPSDQRLDLIVTERELIMPTF